MSRAGPWLLRFLLSIWIVSGLWSLVAGVVGFPEAVERSLARGPMGHHRWLGGLLPEARFLLATTPPDADIAVVVPDAQVRQVLGLPFTLFPRTVRVLSHSPARQPPWLALIDGGAPRGSRRFQAGRLVLSGSEARAHVHDRYPLPPEGRLPGALVVMAMLGALGLLVLRVSPLRAGWAVRLGLGWFLGAGLVAVGDFAMGQLRVPLGARAACLAILAAGLAIAPARWTRKRGAAERPSNAARATAVVLAAAIGTALLLAAALAVLYPRDRWDSFAFWGIKTRALYADGRITGSFLAKPYPHQDYPVLGPVIEAWLFRAAGGECDPGAALLGPITVAAIALLLAGSLGPSLPEPLPVAVAAAVVLTPRLLHEAIGSLMDIHVAGFALAGLVMLARARDSPALHACSGFLFGLAGFTKNDGIPWAVAAVALVAALAITRRVRVAVACSLLGGALAALSPWLCARVVYQLSTDIVNARMIASLSPQRILGQAWPVTRGLGQYLLRWSTSDTPSFDGAFPFALLGGISLVRARGVTRESWVVALAAALIAGLYLSLPPLRLPSYLETTGFRVPLQILPAATLAAATALRRSPP